MKKNLFSMAFIATLLLMGSNSQAQSFKDLFNKDNVSKVVNTVTGKNSAPKMEGTWSFSGSAIEFESDNLLKKAGGAAASGVVEKKIDEQLAKVGIKPGELNFTFNSDSTFTSTMGKRTLKGTYSYNASTNMVKLKYMKLIPLNTKINCTGKQMEMLFESDNVLKLITYLANKSSNATVQSVSKLVKSYDGMMLGFELNKQ